MSDALNIVQDPTLTYKQELLEVNEKFHPYFPTGTGDIFKFEETYLKTPDAILAIIKGSFQKGLRYFSGYDWSDIEQEARAAGANAFISKPLFLSRLAKTFSTLDIIFMDIQMPKMNGYDATRAIRAMDRNYCRQVPIIAMTANAFAEDVQAAKTVGMNEHIAKPLDLHVLAKTLSKWLLK